MSYPSLPMLRSSRAERAAGLEPVRANNGVLKVRRLYGADKMVFTVEHMLAAGERIELENAYTANRTADLSFLWPVDGQTYTVRFGAAPQYTKNGPWWFATVVLHEA